MRTHFRPAYDAAGRPTGAENPGTQPDEHYTYDLLGNRISGGWGGQVIDAANRLTSDNKYLYTYDAEGNLRTRTERALGAVTSYTWDADHRLRSVSLPDGSAQTYRYDPLGRRIEVAGGGGVRRFAYGAGQNRSVQFDAHNQVERSLVSGPGFDSYLGQRSNDESTYFQQDAIRSITSTTSGVGAVTARNAFGAFGSDQGALTEGFGFAGRPKDAGGGLDMRAREYDPETGVFMSEDPVKALNRRQYARNNPVSFTDPTGMLSLGELNATESIAFHVGFSGGFSGLSQIVKCGTSDWTGVARAAGIGAASGIGGGIVARKLFLSMGTLGATSIQQTAFNAKASLALANTFSGGLENVLSQLLDNGAIDPLQAAVGAVVAGAAAPGEVGSALSSEVRGLTSSGIGAIAVETTKMANSPTSSCA